MRPSLVGALLVAIPFLIFLDCSQSLSPIKLRPTPTTTPAATATSAPAPTQGPTATAEPAPYPSAKPDPGVSDPAANGYRYTAADGCPNPIADANANTARHPIPDSLSTPTPSPVPTIVADQDVSIDCVLFDGAVPRSESDEYVQITNDGDEDHELLGWTLYDEGDERQVFVFPQYILVPGKTIRVYTDEMHEEWGGFSFQKGSAVWNNQDADTAVLTDALGRVISERTYDVSSPPGCSD